MIFGVSVYGRSGVEQGDAGSKRGWVQSAHSQSIGRDWRANEKAGLTAFVRELRACDGSDLLRVVLFGSKARGDFDKESDLDLLVVVRMGNGDYRQYWNEIVDLAWRVELAYGIVTSLVIKDVANYDIMREHQLLLARNIEQDGVNLWMMPPSAAYIETRLAKARDDLLTAQDDLGHGHRRGQRTGPTTPFST